MICPYCGANDDKVIDSRATDGGAAIRRRRRCLKCSKRFTTYEHIEHAAKLSVVKKDGSRVPFDRQKVVTGVEKACFKRPVSAEQIRLLAEQVEEELSQRFDREVGSAEIGQAVADRLKRLDQVAYVRYASVYKQFRDLDDLLEEVRDVLAGQGPEQPGQGSLF